MYGTILYPGDSAKKPTNLMVSLMLSQEWMLDSTQNLMYEIGYDMLSRQDYILLCALGNGGKSVFELAELVRKPVAEIHVKTLRLEEFGFIKFIRPMAPVLQKQIVYSKKGWQLINDLSQTLSTIEKILKERVNEQSIQQLQDLLNLNWGPALKVSDLEQYAPVYKQDNNIVDF